MDCLGPSWFQILAQVKAPTTDKSRRAVSRGAQSYERLAVISYQFAKCVQDVATVRG